MKTTLIILLLAFGMKAQNFDKADGGVKHVYASWIGSTIIGTSLNHYIDKPTISSWVGGITMFGIGLGKEYIYDRKMGKGTFSKLDLANDAWGSILGIVTARVVIDIKENKKHSSRRYKLD